MPRRRGGRETLLHEPGTRSTLDEIAASVDGAPIERQLNVVYAVTRGEVRWPTLTMFEGSCLRSLLGLMPLNVQCLLVTGILGFVYHACLGRTPSRSGSVAC